MASDRRDKNGSFRIGAILRQRIANGDYQVGDRLPTISEINADILDAPTGPRFAREAYASLISDGMVEARVGRNGGHFLVSTTPIPGREHLDDAAADIAALVHYAERLAQRSLYIVDIRKAHAKSLGECFQPSRAAAEEFATAILHALGEPAADVERAVNEASHLAAMTRPDGYEVRIYGRRLGDDSKTIVG
jgi:DNA-binding FadR family transcriptional regulator